MKVILLRDVAKIGKRFEIVSVPDGYALNKLIPQKDAEPANPTNIKRINQRKNRLEASLETQSAELKLIADKINAEPLVISVEANEQGHLFQAVHVSDVVDSAKARGIALSTDVVVVNSTIKEIGEHKISLKNKSLYLEVPIKVQVKES